MSNYALWNLYTTHLGMDNKLLLVLLLCLKHMQIMIIHSLLGTAWLNSSPKLLFIKNSTLLSETQSFPDPTDWKSYIIPCFIDAYFSSSGGLLSNVLLLDSKKQCCCVPT